jgi:NAD(P)-dependent dehydrogenase (short-subunit alcohol dehydrogenase family)
MRELHGQRIIITGGSKGLGLAMVEALAARGADVTAIARDTTKLGAAKRVGATTIVGDATDAALMDRIVVEKKPDVLILNAGARLPMKPIDEQNWEEFSAAWTTDVKAGLVGIQAALKAPMRSGWRVLVMSSGAAMVLSVPFIAPENLRLSGGYVGAKRMLWFMAHQANTVSQERRLGIHFQVIVPGQLMPGTELGHAVAAAYAEIEGTSVEEHVLQRYGSIMAPAELAERVAELLCDPTHSTGVAFAIRAGVDIMSLDL